MKQNKKVSGSFIIFIMVMIGILAAFLAAAYFKSNPKVEQPKKEVSVDSSKIIKQKDSIIDVLNRDNVRLKKMFDEKHDTVIIYKVKWKNIDSSRVE